MALLSGTLYGYFSGPLWKPYALHPSVYLGSTLWGSQNPQAWPVGPGRSPHLVLLSSRRLGLWLPPRAASQETR